MSDMERWLKNGAEYGWSMPYAPWWKRLPIIRHVRTIWNQIQVERWYSNGPGMIGLRSGYDDWILFGMWHGMEAQA